MTPTTEFPDEIWVHLEMHQFITRPPNNKWWHEQEMTQYTRKDKADAEIDRLTKERDEWKNKYLMKISEPVGK